MVVKLTCCRRAALLGVNFKQLPSQDTVRDYKPSLAKTAAMPFARARSNFTEPLCTRKLAMTLPIVIALVAFGSAGRDCCSISQWLH